MANYNSCSFIGHLGRDPEVRYTPNGKAVCNLNVAVSRTFGEKQITAWLKIVLWDKLAETIGKSAKKGDEISAVNVEYCQDEFEKDGKKQTSHYFTAHPGSRVHLNTYSALPARTPAEPRQDARGGATAPEGPTDHPPHGKPATGQGDRQGVENSEADLPF